MRASHSLQVLNLASLRRSSQAGREQVFAFATFNGEVMFERFAD